MNTMAHRGWKIGFVVWVLILACNLPGAPQQVIEAETPTLPQEELISTAVAFTLTAQAAGVSSATPAPAQPEITWTAIPTFTEAPTATVTPCYPIVVASVDANVRNGPGKVYDIVGALPVNGTARVWGQNDAKTWWYIEFPSGSGQYAWIAKSVTTSACIPDALQYVAAPPTPTALPTPTMVPFPDLYVSEYTWSPVPPHMGVSFHIRVGVYNQGNAKADAFTVQWWLSTTAPSPTCTWNVASLVAHGGRILECDYTPGGWANYPSRVVVDSGNSVAESDEGNNTKSAQLQIVP